MAISHRAMEITTSRLLLRPASPELLEAEMQGKPMLEAASGFLVPSNWPPELYDEQATRWVLQMLLEVPEMEHWSMHYMVERSSNTVTGTVGYKGPPNEDGTVEIGYALLEQYRGRGYATEAARALVDRAFADPRVLRVTAHTYPHLTASINVMQRSGLSYGGEAEEPGVIYFQITREDYERL